MEFGYQIWTKKIPLAYLGWASIIFLAFLLNMCVSSLNYKRAYEREKKSKIKEIKKEIEFREQIIKNYEKEINYQVKKINHLNYQIDSLNNLKAKVEIRYKKEISKVKQMDAKEITNYWDEEFN